MKQISLEGPGEVYEVVSFLSHEIQNSGISCELVGQTSHQMGNANVVVLVFEKYYWRANNRASLTVVVCGGNGKVNVDAIGSGGGQGAIFKFSWGAESSFAETVRDILSSRGFYTKTSY